MIEAADPIPQDADSFFFLEIRTYKFQKVTFLISQENFLVYGVCL